VALKEEEVDTRTWRKVAVGARERRVLEAMLVSEWNICARPTEAHGSGRDGRRRTMSACPHAGESNQTRARVDPHVDAIFM
jgi:hypothetical protein